MRFKDSLQRFPFVSSVHFYSICEENYDSLIKKTRSGLLFLPMGERERKRIDGSPVFHSIEKNAPIQFATETRAL